MNLEQKVTLTAEARIKELELRWTMTQLFFFIHSALFSVALVQFKPGTIIHQGSCFLGLWLGVLWLLTTVRSQNMLAYWEQKLAMLEGNQTADMAVFVAVDGTIPSPPGWSMDMLLVLLVWTFISAWGTLLAYSLLGLITS